MVALRFGGFIFTPPITKQVRREGVAKINKLYNKNILKSYNEFATNCIVDGVECWGCGG